MTIGTKLPDVTALLLILICSGSCAVDSIARAAAAPAPEAAPKTVLAPVPRPVSPPASAPAAPTAPPAPQLGQVPVVAAAPTLAEATTPEPAPDIKLGGSGPALTETLDRALDRLAEESAENQRLRETVAALDQALAEKQAVIDDLTSELSTCDAKIAQMEDALEQWKKDVLGFRSEMRDYEEAQIQVLQEIAVLLKGFKKEQEAL